MPGAAIEHEHHHFCTTVILGTGDEDIGMCNTCGQYLFVSTSGNETVYRMATRRESRLINELTYMKAQIARMIAR